MPYLALYLDNHLIDRMPLEEEYITTPGYLRIFSRELREKYEAEIDAALSEPELIIEEYCFEMS